MSNADQRYEDWDGAPRRAHCRLASGESFDGLVERIAPSGVFLCTDRPGLQYSEGLRVTLFDDHGPVCSFTGQVVSWVRGRGIRVEIDPETPTATRAQLSDWATERARSCVVSPTLDVVMAAPASGSTPVACRQPVFEASAPERPAPTVALPGRAPSVPGADLHQHWAASQALKGARVLAIDDDPLVLKMLSRGLRRFGCEVEVSDDPPRALELLDRTEIDAVLLDWVLPTIPGAEMLERMRRASAVPIAVVSGALWWDHAADQIRSLGASAVLEKPVDFERLVEWLRRVHDEPAEDSQ